MGGFKSAKHHRMTTDRGGQDRQGEEIRPYTRHDAPQGPVPGTIRGKRALWK